MIKTLDIDEELLKLAKEAIGAETDTEAVHKGLRALVQRAAAERMVALFGSEKGPVVDVPRRREPARGKKSLASGKSVRKEGRKPP